MTPGLAFALGVFVGVVGLVGLVTLLFLLMLRAERQAERDQEARARAEGRPVVVEDMGTETWVRDPKPEQGGEGPP